MLGHPVTSNIQWAGDGYKGGKFGNSPGGKTNGFGYGWQDTRLHPDRRPSAGGLNLPTGLTSNERRNSNQSHDSGGSRYSDESVTSGESEENGGVESTLTKPLYTNIAYESMLE